MKELNRIDKIFISLNYIINYFKFLKFNKIINYYHKYMKGNNNLS